MVAPGNGFPRIIKPGPDLTGSLATILQSNIFNTVRNFAFRDPFESNGV